MEETAIPVEPDGGIGDGAPPPREEPPGAELDASFPAGMRGKWRVFDEGRIDASLCDGYAEGNIGKVLTILPDRYNWFETGGGFKEVYKRSETAVEALFDTTYADQPTQARLRFELQGGGDTLRLYGYDQGTREMPVVYKRCPGGSE